MKTNVDEYLKSGAYLPAPLRDFHDAKEVFKTMHSVVAVEKNEYARSVTWVTGQCYVIDIFLWFMARRGWTLQRSRAAVDFRDLQGDVAARREQDAQAFREALANRNASSPNR